MPPRNRRVPSLLLLALTLVAAMLVSASCKKKPPEPPAQEPAAPAEQPASPSLPQETVTEAPVKPAPEPGESAEDLDEVMRRQNSTRSILRTVYFDFDSSQIRDDQVAILQENAAWLRNHPQYKVVVEGHCDERDTIEYNFALGDRRARSILQYLSDLGIPKGNLRTISYGEERPADPGHDEEAYARNRRVEFTLEP